MQAIGFNEHYGLQTAVFKRKKTMTRRAEKGFENLKEGYFHFFKERNEVVIYGEKRTPIETIRLRYNIGEVVAVRQCYRDIIDQLDDRMREYVIGYYSGSKAWTNKMFIRPDLMPRHIRIIDIKVERLQAISDDDCLKEGIEEDHPCYWVATDYDNPDFRKISDELADHLPDRNGKMEAYYWDSPRKCFAHLIDKVSGKGTWERNQFMPAYSFELID